MGDTFFHCGDIGAGITMKLVNNSMGQIICLAVSECLTLGVKAGLSLELMMDVLSGTAASNKFLEAVFPSTAFKGNYELGFAVDLAHKDLGHALSMAGQLEVPTPTLAVTHQLLNIARTQGKGRKDISVMLNVFEEMAKVEVRSDKIESAKL
jgi:3-hydroxyisobutyrate dehydrogenase-like beta-hydroxyacid dehydrogenase